MLSAATPFSFILFGASGHLAKIKIYPALFVLAQKRKLPLQYSIVGYARSALTQTEFRQLVETSIRTHTTTIDEQILQEFLQHVHYCSGQYDSYEDFIGLRTQLEHIEQGWSSVTRIGYFSVPPTVFSSISHNICRSELGKAPITLRLIVEKPIGANLKTFKEVRKSLTSCFSHTELYLLDHYLGKEAVRNIYFMRYGNPILERILKNTLIHHIEITAMEAAGIEDRAGYFEHTGTFRDMFQSHMLMIISLLTMRLTNAMTDFRKVRLHALEQLYLPPATTLADIALQGQYGAGNIQSEPVKAYLDEKDVAPQSRTNTYAALKLMTRMSRFEGVPVYLRSGKRLPKKETRISIVFQESHDLGAGSAPNRVDIILQGEAGIRFHLQTKMAGLEPVFRPLLVTDPLIPMGDVLPEHGQLLLEVIHGNTDWFLTFEEVDIAWRLLDPIQTYLEKKSTPLHVYDAGTQGPEEAQDWIEQYNTTWLL
jgi:glucose-6-phosphate 1-dehydrogenase